MLFTEEAFQLTVGNELIVLFVDSWINVADVCQIFVMPIERTVYWLIPHVVPKKKKTYHDIEYPLHPWDDKCHLKGDRKCRFDQQRPWQ